MHAARNTSALCTAFVILTTSAHDRLHDKDQRAFCRILSHVLPPRAPLLPELKLSAPGEFVHRARTLPFTADLISFSLPFTSAAPPPLSHSRFPVMDASEFESTGYMALKRKMLQLTASHPELLGLEKEISAAAGKVRAFAVRRTLYNLFFVSFSSSTPPSPLPPPPPPTPLRRSPSSSVFTTRRWRPSWTAAVAARRRTPRL